MNLRFVETFVWVARLQSITRTADTLFLTQSAVSSRIAVLEEEVGAALLDRKDRQFRLTSAGERFLVYAERLLSLQQELRSELDSHSKGRFPLRLGAIETILHAWLIPAMEWVRVRKPGVEFELNVETTPILGQQLHRGTLDLIFSAEPVTGKGIASESFPALNMVFVGPVKLKDQGRMSLDALMAWEILTFQRHSQPHLALLNSLGQAGITGKKVHSITSISALVKLAESGFGLSTLPEAAARELQLHHAITIIDTSLQLSPLPFFANYLSPATTSDADECIAHALTFMREATQPPASFPQATRSTPTRQDTER